MIPDNKPKKSILKKILLAAFVLVIVGAGIAWYIFTAKFEDTAVSKSDYIVNAQEMINEFKKNDTVANKKYADKIITVNCRVTAVEAADTTINLKMKNADESYILFAFQQKDQAAIKNIKAGDSVSIKGSCNGGSYSEILEAESITFKRCSLNK